MPERSATDSPALIHSASSGASIWRSPRRNSRRANLTGFSTRRPYTSGPAETSRHPELERLGLLKYHAALPRDTKWLFPGLPVHKSKNKRSPRVGRAFNNWRRQLGIDYEDRQLDFHSLRHTFDTVIEDVG